MRVKPNAQPNQSLIDGIATLQALATSSEPIGGRELARRLHLHPTRVNRLLKTLAYLGIARQASNRKYMPGPGMHVLSAQSLFASGLIRNALPALEHLRRFGHTVALGVLWRHNVSYLYHAPPGVSAHEALGRIGVFPATRGGIGIALLAALEDKDVAEIYGEEEIPRVPGGLPALLAQLHQVREQGYARVRVKDDENQHTVAITIGSPVHSAIGVSGWIPASATSSIVEALHQAAAEINGTAHHRVEIPFEASPHREAI